jgi:hypothetical protein
VKRVLAILLALAIVAVLAAASVRAAPGEAPVADGTAVVVTIEVGRGVPGGGPRSSARGLVVSAWRSKFAARLAGFWDRRTVRARSA